MNSYWTGNLYGAINHTWAGTPGISEEVFRAEDVRAELAKKEEEIKKAFARGVIAMRDAALNAVDAEAIGRISERLGLGTFEAEEIGKIRNAADAVIAREALAKIKEMSK